MPEQLRIFEPDQRRPRDPRPPRVFGAIAAGAGLLVSSSIAGSLGVPAGLRIVQEIAGAVLLVVAMLQIGISGMRLHGRQLTIPGLRRPAAIEFALLAVLPAAAGAYTLQHEPSQAVVFAFAVAVAVTWPVAEWLEADIAKRIAASPGQRTVTERLRTMLDDLMTDTRGGLFSELLRWFLDSPPGQRISRGRVAMCALLIFAALGLGEAPVVATFTPVPKQERPHGRGRKPRAGDGGQTARVDPVPRASHAPDPPSAPLRARWDQLCTSSPGAGGADVPASVRAHIYALYLGALPHADPGPGADAAGCTGAVFTPSWTEGFYVAFGTSQWTLRLKSVAVDSDRFGWALFLAPAAEQVRQLIRTYGALGGSPRYPVDQGQFYVVHLDVGVAALVRAQLTLTGHPDFAEPFTYVPVAVVQGWVECMREDGRTWLWPLEHRNGDGTTTFVMVDSVITRNERCRIDYDPISERAWRMVDGRVRRYEPGSDAISEDELRALAAG